ncbi:MAG TPA: chemotaxis protein CheB, partial [Planctomycetota bacterium]|nr:chemotaxis protein CheB [Planctomycetota bacterium]
MKRNVERADPERKKPKRSSSGQDGEAKPLPPLIDVRPKDGAFPIVGIGASAGGLEAFTQLLQNLPANTGIAFVFVQHLDPTHLSLLTELLARATSMPVRQVTHGERPLPDHVYVIPPDRVMTIDNGELRLTRRAGSQHKPIDTFLVSLAQDRGSKAIGIILSGTANDGTKGLKAIKAEGGITFAQSERSAKHEGMPRSAIAAGCVDFVLDPVGIAREIARLGKHPYLARPVPERVDDESPKRTDAVHFEMFRLIRAATG